MKATLEFNLPEEEQEHQDAINGTKFKLCLYELDQEIRTWLKHGHTFEEAGEALFEVRNRIRTLLQDRDLSLD